MRALAPGLVLVAAGAACAGWWLLRAPAAGAVEDVAGVNTRVEVGRVVLGERGGKRWNPGAHQGPVHLRLEQGESPRQARVWLEEELLGRLVVDEAGRHSGDAIGRVMGVVRFLGPREVLVQPAPGLAPELKNGLLGLLRQGGVFQVRVVVDGDGLSEGAPGR